jgi:hypothetical protein
MKLLVGLLICVFTLGCVLEQRPEKRVVELPEEPIVVVDSLYAAVYSRDGDSLKGEHLLNGVWLLYDKDEEFNLDLHIRLFLSPDSLLTMKVNIPLLGNMLGAEYTGTYVPSDSLLILNYVECKSSNQSMQMVMVECSLDSLRYELVGDSLKILK